VAHPPWLPAFPPDGRTWPDDRDIPECTFRQGGCGAVTGLMQHISTTFYVFDIL